MTETSADPAWVDTVLAFWFDELQPSHWFKSDAALDARVRERFFDGARGRGEKSRRRGSDQVSAPRTYLPLEHSEVLADQHRAVALIGALGDAEYTHYAEAHRDIIARFGRFPHRNAPLGRASTVDEIAFLAQPGSSF